MLRGLYTAAAGMMTQQLRHDTVTNNIANLNTPGFKSNNALNRSFPDMLISAAGGENTRSGKVGTLSTGVFAEENILSMMQGDTWQTYRSEDMALVSDITVLDPATNNPLTFDASGKHVDPQNGSVTYQPQALFTVNTPQGERYTRDGSFHMSPDGRLLTTDGAEVLGVGPNGQPAVMDNTVIDVPWEDITVMSDGTLVSKSGQGLAANPKLYLTRVENPNNLVREGNGLFRYEGAPGGFGQVAAGDRVEVKQGFLERSNVDASQSAIDIMSAMRAYEANQKVIQFYDRSLDKAVNEVGKV